MNHKQSLRYVLSNRVFPFYLVEQNGTGQVWIIEILWFDLKKNQKSIHLSISGHDIFFFFLNIFYIFVQVQFSAFPPGPPHHPSPPTSFPCFQPQCYCPCVFNNCSCKSFTLFPCNPLPSPLWSLSTCSQFSVSGYILLAYLFR